MNDGGGKGGPTMAHCPLVRLENEGYFVALDNSLISLLPQGDEVAAKTMGGVTLGYLEPPTAAIVATEIKRLGLTGMRAQFKVGTSKLTDQVAAGPYVSVDVVSYAARRKRPGYP